LTLAKFHSADALLCSPNSRYVLAKSHWEYQGLFRGPSLLLDISTRRTLRNAPTGHGEKVCCISGAFCVAGAETGQRYTSTDRQLRNCPARLVLRSRRCRLTIRGAVMRALDPSRSVVNGNFSSQTGHRPIPLPAISCPSTMRTSATLLNYRTRHSPTVAPN